MLQRCPGIVQHLPLNAISSFLCITPQMLSKIRKDITFETRQKQNSENSFIFTSSAFDLPFPSASDLWFRALPRAFLCRLF